MAIDTAQLRASATLLFPQVQGIYPAGSVDRQTAAWVYGGITAGLPVMVQEVFEAISEVLTSLVKNSILWPTLAEDSEVLTTKDADSTVDVSFDKDSDVERTLVGVSTI